MPENRNFPFKRSDFSSPVCLF